MFFMVTRCRLWRQAFLLICFFPNAPGLIVNPVGTDIILPPEDDGFLGPFPLAINFPYFGTTFNQIFVSYNGVLTFDMGVPGYVPDIFPLNFPLIAPFWCDINLNEGGIATYAELSTRDASNEVRFQAVDSALVDAGVFCTFKSTWIFLYTWQAAGFFGSDNAGVTNTFQAILAYDGIQSAAIFQYDDINFAGGTTNGVDSNTGLLPDPITDPATQIAAQVGFNNGDGVRFFYLPGSRTNAVTDLDQLSNVNTPGMFAYRIDLPEIEGTSWVEFADERYFVYEGDTLEIRLIRYGCVDPTANPTIATVLLDTTPDASADLTLLSGGVVTFATSAIEEQQMALFTATVDNVIEGVECFSISITTYNTAAGGLGRINTADVCVLDGTSYVGFADEQFFVVEGNTLGVTLVRNGNVPAGATAAAITIDALPDATGELSLLLAGAVNFADATVRASKGNVIMAVLDTVVKEDIECFGITSSFGTAASQSGHMSNAEVCVIDATPYSTIQFSDGQYFVVEGSNLDVVLIRDGNLPTGSTVGVVVIDAVPDASNDLTLLSGGVATFTDDTVEFVRMPLIQADQDTVVEIVECFSISLNPATTTAAIQIGALGTAQVCVIDATSTIEFSEKQYIVAEGQTLDVTLVRDGLLPTAANTVGVVTFQNPPDPTNDLSFVAPANGVFTFVSDAVLSMEVALISGTSDAVIENIECFTIELGAATTAASVIGKLGTADVCVIDTTSTIEFSEKQYIVAEGQTLDVTLVRDGLLPTAANTVGVVTFQNPPDPTNDLSFVAPANGVFTFASDAVLSMEVTLISGTSDAVIENIECFTIELDAATTAASVIGKLGTADVCVIDTTSTIEFAQEQYFVVEGFPTAVTLVRHGTLPTAANTVGQVAFINPPDPTNDISLINGGAGVGTYSFANDGIRELTMNLVLGTTDLLVENIECYYMELVDPPTTTAASLLGSIDTAQVCVVDSTSTIELADEQYFVEEGSRVAITMVRKGRLPTAADTVGVIEFKGFPDATNDLDYQNAGTITFADDTVWADKQYLVTANTDLIVENIECFEIEFNALATTAADIIGNVGEAEICVIDATSVIEFVQDQYFVVEGQQVEITLVRRGKLPQFANTEGVIVFEAAPDPTFDATIVGGGIITFADNTVWSEEGNIVMGTPDLFIENTECFIIRLDAATTDSADIIGNIATAEVCVIDATSTIEFADEQYYVVEGEMLEIRLTRDGVLPLPPFLPGVISIEPVPDATNDISLLNAGTVIFLRNDVYSEQEFLIMATEDLLIEDIECFQIQLDDVLSEAADIIGNVGTAEVCVIDATSTIEFADEQYFVVEGNELEIRMVRDGVLPTTPDTNGVMVVKTFPDASNDLTLLNGGSVTFADNTVLSMQTALLMGTTDLIVENIECFQIRIVSPPIPTDAADILGNIDTAEVCVIDATSIIEFVQEQYFVVEGETIEISLIRRGVLPSINFPTYDTYAVIEFAPDPDSSLDASLLNAGVVTFDDDTVWAVTMDMVMGTKDLLIEDIECYIISLNPTTTDAADIVGNIGTAEVCVFDATSTIEIADEQYFVVEGETVEVRLIRDGVLPTDPKTIGVIVIEPDPDATDDLTLLNDGTYVFLDNTVRALQMELFNGTKDLLIEDIECFQFRLDDVAKTAADIIGNIGTAEICVFDATSWIEFADEQYYVYEGDVLSVRLVRGGRLPDDPNLNGVVHLQSTPDSSDDLVLLNDGTYVFVNNTIRVVQMELLMAILDTPLEGVECFQMELVDALTYAADIIGNIDTAEVCLIDATSDYHFEKVVYHVLETARHVTVAILRSGANVHDIVGTVEISTTDKHYNRHLTAENGTDFVGFEDEVLVYEIGDEIERYTISLADNIDVHKQEFFEVCMSDATYGTIEGPKCAMIYINEDDVVYGFDNPTYYVKEGTSVNISVVRFGSIEFAGTVEISSFEVTATSQSDFRSISNEILVFEATKSVLSLEVSAFGPDNLLEDEERFQVCLANSARGSIGLYGLIRCASVVIQDGDNEIFFGDTSYTVNEATGSVTIHVVRTGYLKSIASVDVVSVDSNAKSGLDKDFVAVSHTVIFGEEETGSSFDIAVRDDSLVESPEFFYLELTNINGAILGVPRIAEVVIEDNNVMYRFDRSAYSVREFEAELTLTIIRDGYLDQETAIEIYTHDITAKSSSTDIHIEDWDFLPIGREKVHFTEDQRYQTIAITIIDDVFYELSETFQVFLESQDRDQLGVPNTVVVSILSDDIRCTLECENDGFCISPTECQCADGYTGNLCEQDIDECLIRPPVCKGNNIMCINRVGSYECVCTETDMQLIGNTCKVPTSKLTGSIYLAEYQGTPLEFNNDMYDTKSDEFVFWADIIEKGLADAFGYLEGFQDVRVTMLFPTENGVGAAYDVSFKVSATATESDLEDRLVASIKTNGYLGDTLLSLTGITVPTRNVDGVFYIDDSDGRFEPDIFDTSSNNFITFADRIEAQLANEMSGLEGFEDVHVEKVYSVDKSIMGVEYQVIVSGSSTVRVMDVDQLFLRKTNHTSLGVMDLALYSPSENCASTTCSNGGVCKVNSGFRITCLCDDGYAGNRCKVEQAGQDGNTDDPEGLSMDTMMMIGFGSGVSLLTLILLILIIYYIRLPN